MQQINIFKTKKDETHFDTVQRVLSEIPTLFKGKKFKMYQTAVGDLPFPVTIRNAFVNKFVTKSVSSMLHVATLGEKNLANGDKFYEVGLYICISPSLLLTGEMIRIKFIGSVARSNVTITSCTVKYVVREDWVDGLTVLKNKKDE